MLGILSDIVVRVQAFNAVALRRSVPTILPATTSSLCLQKETDDQQLPSSSVSFSSCYVDTNGDSASYPRELRFHMINLIRNDEQTAALQEMKYDALTSIVQACSSIAQQHEHEQLQDYDYDGIFEEEGNNNSKSSSRIIIPEHLAPLRRFLRISSHNAKEHQGSFRIFTQHNPPTSSASYLASLHSNVITLTSEATATRSVLASLPSNVLFSQENPFSFLRDSLSYQPIESIQKRGGMLYDGSEAVVWCTAAENSCSLTTSSSTATTTCLAFASRIMDNMPLIKLNLASGLGGSAREEDNHIYVELDTNTLYDLESIGILLLSNEDNGECDNGVTDGMVCCKLNPYDLAIIETVLGSCCNTPPKILDPYQSTIQEEQQSTIIKLINAAVEKVRKDPLNDNNEPHLVLIAHSISASVVAAAIATWKNEQIQQKQQPIQRMEDLLHQAVTVLTLGNVCQSFVDGPAYIHISMYDDPWTTALGSSSSNDVGGGRDAVYFHACSPYQYDQECWENEIQFITRTAFSSLKSHNAHNVNACCMQYLYLIMRINGIQSFRALYDAARFVDPTQILDINPKHFAVNCNHGDLVIPPHIDDELLPAMIRTLGVMNGNLARITMINKLNHFCAR